MGVWDWLRYGTGSSRVRPQVTAWVDRSHLSAVAWVGADLFGVDALGVVSRAEAMTVPAFARARHVVCSAARLPLVAAGADGPLEQQPALVVQPDPTEPRLTTLTWTLDDLLWHGVAWWLVTDRYSTGFPRHAVRCDPAAVDYDADGHVTVDGIQVDDRDMIRFDGPHEGVLTFAARTIRSGARIERAAARIADNPVPMTELHNSGPDLDDTEIAALLDGWTAARLATTGGVGYTNAAVEVRTHGAPAQDLIDHERAQVAVDAARVVGLPAEVLDAPVTGGSTLSYDNPASRMVQLLDLGLSAYTTALEARLSMDDVLPHGVWAEFDVSAFGSFGYAAAVREGPVALDQPALPPGSTAGTLATREAP